MGFPYLSEDWCEYMAYKVKAELAEHISEKKRLKELEWLVDKPLLIINDVLP